jgi:hypothetical protein
MASSAPRGVVDRPPMMLFFGPDYRGTAGLRRLTLAAVLMAVLTRARAIVIA